MWKIEYERIVPWLDEQDDETITSIFAALEMLEREGPNLGRPLVDTLSGTNVSNLKELRPASTGNSEVRILFAFDPKRKAILLIGGDKASGKSGKRKWSKWYRKAIPQAERLWFEHLNRLGENDG